MRLDQIKADLLTALRQPPTSAPLIQTLLQELTGTPASLKLPVEQQTAWGQVVVHGVYTNKHKAQRVMLKLPRLVVDPDRRQPLAEVKRSKIYHQVQATMDLVAVTKRVDGKKAFVLVYSLGEPVSAELRCEEVVMSPMGKVPLFS